MQHVHMDHLLDMVNKFEQERGHELEMKRTWKKKRVPHANGHSVDEDINF
jgi:hypothetical protein